MVPSLKKSPISESMLSDEPARLAPYHRSRTPLKHFGHPGKKSTSDIWPYMRDDHGRRTLTDDSPIESFAPVTGGNHLATGQTHVTMGVLGSRVCTVCGV